MSAGFWMDEASGVLRPAVETYLTGREMTEMQIATLRAYLRQWINDPRWAGPAIGPLRRAIDELTTHVAIDQWLDDAAEVGLDPL